MALNTFLLLLYCGGFIEWTSDGSDFFELPDSVWVEPGSSSVILVEDNDTLSVFTGSRGSRIGFLVPSDIPAGTELVFLFRELPLSTPVRKISQPVSETSFYPGSQSVFPEFHQSAAPGLYISGEKRLGVSVGEGGGLDQALSLSIHGMLTSDIEVSGELTDENMPLGSGSSELITELDQVLLRISGPGFATYLGNMEWQGEDAEYGPFVWERKLSGIRAEIFPGENNEHEVYGGYGSSADRSENVVFYTSEGLQGPYYLVTNGGIAPGTERVFLDGNPMRRGVTADYTIDYSSGSITFTSRRLIRKDQRVEAYFATQSDGYRREFITAGTSLTYGSVNLELFGLSETDDRNDPIGFVQTDETIQALEEAGSNPDSAYVFGGSEVGSGEGSYDVDSLGHFIYRGPGLGTWNVIFNRPPDGKGDYIYDSSIGGYAWAGEDQGTHLPRQYLALPERLRIGGLSGSIQSGLFSFVTKTALSQKTGNLFAEEATGRGGVFFQSEGRFFPSPGSFEVGVRLQAGTEGFNPADRLEADSSLAHWSLPPGYTGIDDKFEGFISSSVGELSAGTRLLEEGGKLTRLRTGFQSYQGLLRWNLTGAMVRRSETPILRTGNRNTAEGQIFFPPVSFLEPRLLASYRHDQWSDSLEGNLLAGGCGLAWKPGTIDTDLLFEYEKDNRTGNFATGPDRMWRGRFELSGNTGSVRLEGNLEHSESSFEEGGSVSSDAIMARASGNPGWGWFQALYSGSGVFSRQLEVRYRYVGEGEGDYSFDETTGTYYPDPYGDYEMYYAAGESDELVVEADLETRLSFNAAGEQGIDFLLKLNNSNTGERFRTLLLLNCFNSSVTGGYEVEVSPWIRWDSGLLRRLTLLGRVTNENVIYSGTGSMNEKGWRAEVRPRFALLTRFYCETAVHIWQDREELYQVREITGVRAQVDPSWAQDMSSGFDLGLMIAYENRREKYNNLSGIMYETKPHVSWRGGGWRASSYVQLSYIPGEGEFPPWFFELADRGLSLRPQIRIGKNVSGGVDISLFYSGRKLAGSDWIHRGGLEGSLTF